MNENGTLDYIEPETSNNCSAAWHFIHNVTVSCQLTPDPQTIGHPYFRDFIWKKNDAGSANINDDFSQTCIDPQDGSSHFQGYTVRDTGLLPTNFVLLVDTSNQTYSVGWSSVFVPVTSEIRYDGNSFPGNIGISWSVDALSSNSLPTAGMILHGQESFRMEQFYLAVTPASGNFVAGDPRFGGTSPLQPSLLTGDLTVTWMLTPVREELEVIIEPDHYEEWLPKGDLQNWNNPGNILLVNAKLRTKDGNVPVSRAQRFRFELLEVSSEPGVCLNRPAKQFANEDSDLRFASDLNQPPIVAIPLEVSNGGKTATTPNDEYVAVEAAVTSYDFGAYGKLKVTAEVYGQEIVGYLDTDETKTPQPILIPRRQPDSHIADQWKEDNGITGKADSADDEDTPGGDGHKGDGLTLYEEYRGFSESLKHVRANPKKKDFFVSDGIRSADSGAGIALFTAQTGLEVHSKMRVDEFNVDVSSLASPVETSINFNHGMEHVVDQHGILIVEKDVSNGTSFADALTQGGTPAQYQRVWIDRAAYGWQDVRGSDGSRIQTFQGAGVIAHELAHTCAVWHHGDDDEEDVLWRLDERVINGETNLVAMEVNGQSSVEIEIRFEGGEVYWPFYNPGATKTVWIGVPQGQHSGDQECFMRYALADAYRSIPIPKVRYVVRELAGVHLCVSPSGTGVNDSMRQYGSRYGDAAPLRGNCRSQICVNDLYNGAASHQR